MRSLCVGASILLVIAVVGCDGDKAAKYSAPAASRPSHGAPPWPAPPDPLARIRAAGLTSEPHEFFGYHVHAHLDVFVNGKPIRVPGGIGIDVDDPAVRSDREQDGTIAYGGISDCGKPCISPLHTHADDGVLHTESQRNEPNKLGAFFTEWGVPLSRICVGGYCKPADPVAFFVEGKRYTRDPRQITLTNLKEIAIVVGSPPKQIPSRFPQS